MQLVVLAGGFGTRLRGSIREGLPKPMAEIAGKPFIVHLLDRAIDQGADRIHLLVGYAAQVIIDYLGDSYGDVPVTYSREDEPLGTGGALKAAQQYLADTFILANGDTFADVSFRELLDLLEVGVLALSLAHMSDSSRYGTVDVADGVVIGFREKRDGAAGLVNAGVYACRKELLDLFPGKSSFSFEREFLEPELSRIQPQFLLTASEIIDIGTPESLALANNVFARNSSTSHFDRRT
ncbi:sugar phosphate nucleotidyltransferase [Mycolicibacterium iranicum]|uniref:Sugar phosphate nucleotidyltransferase n=2 Tax=Mycolicibacterium iranicum TaxID=912594 RepID=A0ABT4HIS1_MYCIR|nr:sugar phosphate nucleotidyltransferase [Mycolicibacterium iranicum]MCZ0730103.1 sugar phosphate nucleotidyltransferase [Mycolicibacterium iranicum]